MRVAKTERNIVFLVVAVGALSALAGLVNAYPPSGAPALAAFSVLTATATFSLLYYLTLHVRRSALVTVGILVVLLLRTLNLRHPLYVLMLAALLGTLELTFAKFADRA